MKLETHGSKVYLVAADTGSLHVPATLFLNEKYTNHHTKQAAAKALRVWVRLADAFDIDLAARALEGRWVTEAEKKALRHLVFRPIEEIESMSDRALKAVASATRDVEPRIANGAVEPNTALKQLVGIAKFLVWFHEKVLEPRMPITSPLVEVLRRQVETCAAELKRGVGSTKSSHPHRIKSVPRERFLQIYSAVYLRSPCLFKTVNGKAGSNLLRDRAMILLASEGIRPGAIGNIARSDFKWAGNREPGYLTVKDNTSKRSKKLSANTPVQKGTASNQNYNSEITIPIWPTTAEAIQEYIDSERAAVTTHGLRNRSEGFLFLAEHGGPIGNRGTIANVFRRAGKDFAAMGLLSKDPKDPYLTGEAYEFDAYLLRHSAISLFYSEKIKEKKDEVVKDLMKQRFGWSMESTMPALYARRAMSDAASVTVEDYMESLFSEAKSAKKTKGRQKP